MKIFQKLLLPFLLSALLPTCLYTQNTEVYSYKAVYEVEIKRKLGKTPPHGFLEAEAVLKNVPMVLLFNQNVATFYVDYTFNKDILEEFLASALIDYRKQYFNKNTNKFQTWMLISDNQTNVLVEDDKSIEWTVDKDNSIQINDLNCYHATGELKSAYFGDYLIEAWYTPTISTPFGPNGVGGLNGLIVELKIKHKRFTLKSISLEENIYKWIEESEAIDISTYIEQTNR